MECKYAVYLERVGAEVVECACVVGLPEVKVMLNPYILTGVPFSYWSLNSSSYLIVCQ